MFTCDFQNLTQLYNDTIKDTFSTVSVKLFIVKLFIFFLSKHWSSTGLDKLHMIFHQRLYMIILGYITFWQCGITYGRWYIHVSVPYYTLRFFFLNINKQSVKCKHYKSIQKMIFFTNDITANNKTFCTYQIVNEKNDNGSGHSTTGLNYCIILRIA